MSEITSIFSEKNYNDKALAKDYYSLARLSVLPFVPASIKTVLEPGCSDGSFGVAVKEKYDCEYWGVEPHKESAQKAVGRLDKIINDIYEPSNFPESHFDLLVFNDVIEHIPYPDEMLEASRKILKPGGHILASIPNFLNFPNVQEIFMTEDFRYRESGILDKTHFRFFTRKSIIRIFEEAGYEVEVIQGINPNINSFKFKFLNFMLMNKLKDFKYLQFVVRAKMI